MEHEHGQAQGVLYGFAIRRCYRDANRILSVLYGGRGKIGGFQHKGYVLLFLPGRNQRCIFHRANGEVLILVPDFNIAALLPPLAKLRRKATCQAKQDQHRHSKEPYFICFRTHLFNQLLCLYYAPERVSMVRISPVFASMV